MRSIHRQRGGSREAMEYSLPVIPGRIPILLLQPGNVFPIRTRSRRLILQTVPDSFIKISDLRKENRHTPSVEKRMVVAPDELEPILVGADQCDAHRRFL